MLKSKLKGRELHLTLGVLILLALITLIVILSVSTSPIPDSVRKQLNFAILYPEPTGDLSTDKSTIKYDQSTKTLTFITKVGGVDVTTAEQATPESFTDAPQAYDKLVGTLNEYYTFDSTQGTVSLTKPKELQGQQTAVMSAKGVLIFSHPVNGSLTNDQWKEFFNALISIQA